MAASVLRYLGGGGQAREDPLMALDGGELAHAVRSLCRGFDGGDCFGVVEGGAVHFGGDWVAW